MGDIITILEKEYKELVRENGNFRADLYTIFVYYDLYKAGHATVEQVIAKIEEIRHKDQKRLDSTKIV